MVQDIEYWRDLVNAVMKLLVPENAGNFLTSQEGFWSMELVITRKII